MLQDSKIVLMESSVMSQLISVDKTLYVFVI